MRAFLPLPPAFLRRNAHLSSPLPSEIRGGWGAEWDIEGVATGGTSENSGGWGQEWDVGGGANGAGGGVVKAAALEVAGLRDGIDAGWF